MSLQKLEWSLITQELAKRTRSPLGEALSLNHTPFDTPSQSFRLRVRVKEARILLESSPVHGYLADTQDTNEFLDRAAREGTLDPAQIWACGHFFSTLGSVGEELRPRSKETPNWAGDFDLAPKTPPLSEKIRRSVSSLGTILDSASPELARLRAERGAKRSQFEGMLDQKVKEWHSKGLLQDQFFDVVDGRYVVPVKAEHHSKMGGALLGKSNTGQSFFMEPQEWMVSNNALKEIEIALRAEEFRILRALSQEIGKLAPVYAPWIEVIAELDLALAAATLARDWELTEPDVSESIALIDFFHPALKLQNVRIIKNSLTLEAHADNRSGGRGLLISGPNTGGKTVLLKAVAMCANMARAGLFIPAAEGSSIPHYADILALIGDEQSISAGLSSFSAQIKDMNSLFNDQRKPLLIVVDEILSSTDPEQASVLAQSLIEEFISRGHHMLVTSHFSDLSLRAKTNPNITVAAMEFDLQASGGVPTYHMKTGELGSSHALEIAKSLGIPEKILTRAQSLLSSQKMDFFKLQEELRSDRREFEEEKNRERSAMAAERMNMRDEYAAKLASFVKDAEVRLQDAIKAFEAQTVIRKKGSTEILRSTANALQEIKQLAKESSDNEVTFEDPLPIEAGSHVLILGTRIGDGPAPSFAKDSLQGAQAKVLSIKGKGADAIAVVQAGLFRVERRLDELKAFIPKNYSTFKPKPNYSISGEGVSVASKLDVRGRRVDDALAAVEQYLDQALRSGTGQVTVITGHGTGAIKAAVKDLLKRLPYVKGFKPEREGDDGALLVEFD